MSYKKQPWADGSSGNTPITAARLGNIERGIEAITKQPPYVPRHSLGGVAHTEVPVYTSGINFDGAFDESYTIGSNTLPNPWPVDCYGDMVVLNNAWTPMTSQSGVGTVGTYRIMMDGTDLMIFNYGGFEMKIYIDGRPYANNPVLTAASTGFAPYGFQKLVFSTARPRLIEIRSMSTPVAFYTKKPYRIWKPAPDSNPKLAVVGDSFVYPIVMSNTAAGNFSPDTWARGMWQGMESELGITSIATDGVGGTGYLAGSTGNTPYSHASRTSWLTRIKPDVIVMHGGGINDLYNSFTNAAIIAAVVARFTDLRANFPDAKLVFVEGFAPPLFTPATYNPNFIAIRQAVQTALEAASIRAYYLDIATTRPPLKGTGYVTGAVAGENTSIYIGSDQAHPTQLGHQYLRSILAGKMKQVLADKGPLEGTLIL